MKILTCHLTNDAFEWPLDCSFRWKLQLWPTMKRILFSMLTKFHAEYDKHKKNVRTMNLITNENFNEILIL